MTQYFFDYVSGNDANNGLSTGAPKQTLAELRKFILAGNVLSLNRGVVWPRTSNTIALDIINFPLASVCTINSYGNAAAPPIIDLLAYDNSPAGWTYSGSGIWTKPTNAVSRVLLGGSISNLSGSGLAMQIPQDPNPPLPVDAVHPWYYASGTLSIYTGSATVCPPVFYGGLAYTDDGAQTGVRFRDSKNFLVQNIKTVGGHNSGWNWQASATDVSDIQLDDCEAHYVGRTGNGFSVESDPFTTNTTNRRITLNRPVFNMQTNATENGGAGSGVVWGGNDGIMVTANYDAITVYDPTIIRARHTGINVFDLSTSGRNSPGTFTLIARSGYGMCDCSVIDYGRALGLIGSQPSQNTKVSGIKVTGQVTRSQFSGTTVVSGCSWTSNRFDNVVQGFESSQVVWFQSWDASPGDSSMIDVTFQNNLIENPISAPIALIVGSQRSGSFDANKIKIYNNTIIDVAYYQDSRRTSPLSVQSIQAGVGVPYQLVKNNNLITPNPGGNQVNWAGAVTTINGTTGFTGNVENVEGYVNRAGGDYHPNPSGGLKYAGVAGAASVLDLSGLPFNSTPSIAPSEFVEYFNDEDTANMLINGNWLIDQINEGALYTINAAAVQGPDGWSGSATAGSGVFKVRRLADPDNTALKCLEITCTTIDASIAATDAYYIHTAIEGYDAASLMAGTALAQAITISFNFKSNVNGTYGISVANSALNRSYVGTFTVGDANEHPYTLTLTLDTAGTWLYDNGVGVRLRICLAAGSNFQKAAGAWGSDNMLTTSAQTNFMSNVANIAFLKRIQLVLGSVALPFKPQDIQKELAKCQRYYWKTFPVGTAVAQNAGNLGTVQYRALVGGAVAHTFPFRFPVPMRDVPTITGYNPLAANAKWRVSSPAGDSDFATMMGITGDGASFNNNQVAGNAVGTQMLAHFTANARLT